MKRIMLTSLLSVPATPALAATGAGFSDLQFALLIVANLLIGTVLFFCGAVLVSVLLDHRRARKKLSEELRRERPEQTRTPRGAQRPARSSARGKLALEN